MVRYLIKRILMIIPIVFAVLLILFLLLYYIPASRIGMMPIYRGDALDSVFRYFNAERNLITQYIRYCYNIITGFNFGTTGTSSRWLAIELGYRTRNTLLLLLTGVGATVLVGIPVGVLCAVWKDSPGDRIMNIITLFLSSIPAFAVAMALTLVLCVYWRVLPLIPYYTELIAFLLPSLVIAFGGISSIVRMTRTSILEVLDQPYITALNSKGLRKNSVIWRHALKNALVPVISTLGVLISQLLCWTLVVEYFFNVPGLGTLMLKSVVERDHISILACTVVMTAILCSTNTAADILYSFVNPRIRLRYAKTRAQAE